MEWVSHDERFQRPRRPHWLRRSKPSLYVPLRTPIPRSSYMAGITRQASGQESFAFRVHLTGRLHISRRLGGAERVDRPAVAGVMKRAFAEKASHRDDAAAIAGPGVAHFGHRVKELLPVAFAPPH